MAISEKDRQALQEKLDQVLGPKDAWALMEEVSGRDWGQFATKIDLDHLAALGKRDIEGLEGRMHAQIQGLEGRMHAQIQGLEGRMDARFEAVDARFEAVEERIVRVEGVLSAKIDGLGHRLEGVLGHELGNVYRELAAHTRTTVFACIAAVMTAAGVALASARL